MSVNAVIRMPDENRGVLLRGHPMVFLVTGEDTKHSFEEIEGLFLQTPGR